MGKETVIITSYGTFPDNHNISDKAKQYYSAILSSMQNDGRVGYLKLDGSDVVFVEIAEPKNTNPLQYTLSDIRAYKGYTEDETAEYCGVSVRKMKGFESNPGSIPASIAIKLRKLYGIPLDYIKI